MATEIRRIDAVSAFWMAIGGLTTAVVIAVLAAVYNAVAGQYRGIEVTLSE